MIFSPRFVTTMASLAAPRLVHALRIRGVTTAAATATAASATATGTTRTTTRRHGASSGGGSGEPCVVSAALHFLEDKKRLLECLDPEDYTAVDAGIGASVGGHVRHSLDHFEKLVSASGETDAADAAATPASGVAAAGHPTAAAATAPIVRYDRRARGGSIEKDPAAAIQVISSLLEQLQALPRGASLRAKRVAPTFMLGGGGGGGAGKEEFEFESNLERELFFCCHHGTHHDAMIQLILRGMGEKGELALSQAGKGFGVAPSTVEFLRKQKEEEEEEERRKHKGA